MSDTRLTTTAYPPVAYIDARYLGQLLIKYIAGASLLSHRRVAGTFKDYVNLTDAPPELQFLAAAFTQPVPGIIAEWYGGTAVADAIAQADGPSPPRSVPRHGSPADPPGR